MARSRVFVSSVVDDFHEYREAARRAIVAAGGEPVLVNEDFPALARSSRNACLDGVRSSDIHLAICGARGGWMAPSGKSVVEEEYEEAVRRKIPILLFVQDGAHDAVADAFIARASDYVSGTLRRTFSSPESLEREIRSSLTHHLPTNESLMAPPPDFERLLAGPKPQGNEVVLRVVLAPERHEEIIDPVTLGSVDLLDSLLAIAHKRSIGLLDYSKPKESAIERDTIRIRQGGASSYGSHDVTIGLTEHGLLVVDSNVTGRRRGFADGMVVARTEIEQRMTAVLRFYAAVLGELDPYMRHQRVFFNAALLNLGYRTIVRDPKPQASYTMNIMRGDGPIVAYNPARPIGRADLSSPDAEVERALTVIERELAPR